jgi:putative transposase
MMKSYPVRKRIRLPSYVYEQGHAFFITIATHRKYPWFLLYPNLGKHAIGLLRHLISAREATLFAWCIMPDHIHLLLRGDSVVEFVGSFKGTMTPMARQIEAGRRLWQRSFFDHALRDEESLYEIVRYIWENPVRAKIVENHSDYPWSGSEVWTDWREFCGRG